MDKVLFSKWLEKKVPYEVDSILLDENLIRFENDSIQILIQFDLIRFQKYWLDVSLIKSTPFIMTAWLMTEKI